MKNLLFIGLLLPGLCGAGPLDGLLIPLAERKEKESEGWWRFSDELVTFELPAKAVKVVVSQVKSPDVPKPGERNVSSLTMDQEPRENPFARLYSIKMADGEEFGSVRVVDQPWFDKAICWCGPIAMEQFAIEDGNLLQFSQMPEGILKIAQATNGTHRAKLDEWTHSKIPFQDYERIGASLRLNTPSNRTPDEWIEVTRGKEGQEAMVGWLRVGMAVKDIRRIMGVPLKGDDSVEVHEARRVFYDGTGYSFRFTLPVSGGKLMRPAEGWKQTEEIIPPHQVPGEIGNLVSFWNRSLEDEKEKAPPKGARPYVIPKDQIRQVKEAFHRDAPFAGGKQWEDWCQLLLAMDKAGVRDQQAAQMIARRFEENADLRISDAVEVIGLYKIPGRYVMMASLVERILDSPDEGKDAGDFIYIAWMAEKGGLLTLEHVRKAVDHPSAGIRSDALYLIDALPRKEAREIMKKRMIDPDPQIRDRAISMAPYLCAPADESWLRKLAEQEKDADCKDSFERLFHRLKEGR